MAGISPVHASRVKNIQKLEVRIEGFAPYVQACILDPARQSRYRSAEGWCGIPMATVREALLAGARLANLKQHALKHALKVETDGKDVLEDLLLVRLNGLEEPNLRWTDWWLRLRLSFNADLLSPVDVRRLVIQTGLKIGIGRHNSLAGVVRGALPCGVFHVKTN